MTEAQAAAVMRREVLGLCVKCGVQTGSDPGYAHCLDCVLDHLDALLAGIRE